MKKCDFSFNHAWSQCLNASFPFFFFFLPDRKESSHYHVVYLNVFNFLLKAGYHVQKKKPTLYGVQVVKSNEHRLR